MRQALALSLAILLPPALPAVAEAPMTAAEFDAYVTGKTLYYSHLGVDYGIEQYLPGRRVIWAFLDGDCQDGTWYQRGEAICFDYEGGLEAQCWRFFRESSGIRAEFAGATAQIELYEAREAEEPILCYGPDIGV
jgi:hypothetical protein